MEPVALPAVTSPARGTLLATMNSSSPSSVVLQSSEEQHGFLGVLTTIFGVVWYILSSIPSVVLWTVTFSTITLPTWLFNVFSISLTFTMNFTTLLLIALIFVSLISWFIRYRFLNVYARLPSEPQRKEPQIDLFPDTQNDDSKPGLHNYLDEFLSAIKVFGYLERPVFHELTRTMQTRKLMAGETILLEEEKGFCMVVDGLVQIFVKSLRERSPGDVADNGYFDVEDSYHEGNQGYQLLTEVKNGAPMSSLFSILALFTEDVKLRHETSSQGGDGAHRPHTPDSTLPTPGATNPSTPAYVNSEANSFQETDGVAARPHLPRVPPLTLEPGFDEALNTGPRRKHRRQASAHPDIVARALVDTTIAIVPASAFRRLTRVYPKATAHIVQVILTRLQRVTFSTAHQYLGLTSELLQIEKLMNKYTSLDLPNHLRGGALERLRDKFSKERDRLGDEDITKGIALHNPVTNRRRSSSSLRKEAALAARIAASRAHPSSEGQSTIHREDKYNVSPGDLVSNTHISRQSMRPGNKTSKLPDLPESTATRDRLHRDDGPLPAREDTSSSASGKWYTASSCWTQRGHYVSRVNTGMHGEGIGS